MEDLTQEKVKSIFEDDSADVLAQDTYTRDELAIAKRLLPALTDKAVREARKAADASVARQVAEQIEALNVQNKEMIQAEIDKWKKKNVPPSQEELNTLLTQEYLEFTVEIVIDGDRKKKRSFTICELPSKGEKKFFHVLRNKVMPNISAIMAVDFGNVTVGERLTKLVDVIPDGLDMLAELTAVALDPRGKHKDEITPDWVDENLSLNRQIHIIECQFRANRLRDFTSAVSRVIGSFGQN